MYKDKKRQREYMRLWRKKHPNYHANYWRTVIKPLAKGRK